MDKEAMIEYLMEELGSTLGSDNVYDIAEHFYKKWLKDQDTTVVAEIYDGSKKYWEF